MTAENIITTTSTITLLTLRAALRSLGAFTDGRFLVHYEAETRHYGAEFLARVRGMGFSGGDTYEATIITVFDRETSTFTQVDYEGDWSHIAAIEAAVKVRGAASRRWRALLEGAPPARADPPF